jgi:hypothetical protein
MGLSGDLPQGELKPREQQHAQKGTACAGRAASQSGAAYVGLSSMSKEEQHAKGEQYT